MTRDQRTRHARTFFALAPLLLIVLALAFARERQTTERLGAHASRPAALRGVP